MGASLTMGGNGHPFAGQKVKACLAGCRARLRGPGIVHPFDLDPAGIGEEQCVAPVRKPVRTDLCAGAAAGSGWR